MYARNALLNTTANYFSLKTWWNSIFKNWLDVKRFGTGSGTRTRNPWRGMDFKSIAYTNSAIPASTKPTHSRIVTNYVISSYITYHAIRIRLKKKYALSWGVFESRASISKRRCHDGLTAAKYSSRLSIYSLKTFYAWCIMHPSWIFLKPLYILTFPYLI